MISAIKLGLQCCSSGLGVTRKERPTGRRGENALLATLTPLGGNGAMGPDLISGDGLGSIKR